MEKKGFKGKNIDADSRGAAPVEGGGNKPTNVKHLPVRGGFVPQFKDQVDPHHFENQQREEEKQAAQARRQGPPVSKRSALSGGRSDEDSILRRKEFGPDFKDQVQRVATKPGVKFSKSRAPSGGRSDDDALLKRREFGPDFKDQVQSAATKPGVKVSKQSAPSGGQSDDDVLARRKEFGPDFKDQVQRVATKPGVKRVQELSQAQSFLPSPEISDGALSGQEGISPDFKDQVRPSGDAVQIRAVAPQLGDRRKSAPAHQEYSDEDEPSASHPTLLQDEENLLVSAHVVEPTVRPVLVNATPVQQINRRRMLLTGFFLLVAVAAAIAAVLLTVRDGDDEATAMPTASSTANPTTTPTASPTATPTAMPTPAPTLPPADILESLAIVSYINEIKLSLGKIPFPPSNSGTPEERSVWWLIHEDPLRLTVDTAAGRFRIEQRYALLTLWFQSNEPWVNSSNWLSEDECKWYGLICEEEDFGDEAGTQNVLKWLDLDGGRKENNLHGSIPDDIALLTSLLELDLGPNSRMSGTFPSTIGPSLSKLTLIDFGYIGMYGALPSSVGKLSQLKEFWAQSNALSGTLPSEIGDLDLLEFSVRGNKLNGTVPESITNWRNIQRAFFHENDFSGTIPSGICTAVTGDDVLEADCVSEVVCSCCTTCF